MTVNVRTRRSVCSAYLTDDHLSGPLVKAVLSLFLSDLPIRVLSPQLSRGQVRVVTDLPQLYQACTPINPQRQELLLPPVSNIHTLSAATVSYPCRYITRSNVHVDSTD